MDKVRDILIIAILAAILVLLAQRVVTPAQADSTNSNESRIVRALEGIQGELSSIDGTLKRKCR